MMPTIALRVPTVLPGTEQLPGGQCYLLFDQTVVTVRELIAAKIGGELRKARAGGTITTSLPLLLPPGTKYGFTPLDEQLATIQACKAFKDGRYLLVRNGQPLVELDETVVLDRHTKIAFIHVATVHAQPVEAPALDMAA